MTARPPLLFLDVDGPLLPFGADPRDLPDGYPTWPVPPGSAGAANPLLARLDPGLGPRLAALPCEPVWATTWTDEANTCLAPLLGLPPLPVVHRPDPEDEDDHPAGLHWKTRPLVDRAAGRAFAWVDDEITAADRAWVAAHHPGAALLHRVDARRGLTDEDFTALGAWLRAPAPRA
ncbi:hypothetical protein [Kitasatospora sp. NBC_01539]|uniref:hypothetical protein n=1 Tax=Kitasatospora sp. NBC_01539 TaxID=2903577 RepID=UPI0038600DE9